MDFVTPTEHLLPLPVPALPQGAIFDCDGTLVDTMPTHYVAWRKTFDDLGYPTLFPESQFYDWGGVPPREIIERLNAQHGVSIPPTETADRKEDLYRTLIPGVQPIALVVAEAKRLKVADIPLAVASGGRRDVVLASLEAAGIRDLFDVVLGAEDAAHGKPAPDVFLKAAGLLGVPPGDCVVYEDAPAGILAAHRAGMHAVDVTRYLPRPS